MTPASAQILSAFAEPSCAGFGDRRRAVRPLSSRRGKRLGQMPVLSSTRASWRRRECRGCRSIFGWRGKKTTHHIELDPCVETRFKIALAGSQVATPPPLADNTNPPASFVQRAIMAWKGRLLDGNFGTDDDRTMFVPSGWHTNLHLHSATSQRRINHDKYS